MGSRQVLVRSGSSVTASAAADARIVSAEQVDQYVAQLRSGWCRGYITAKRRGQLGRKVPKENSLLAYATWIKRAEDLGLPDLATCTLEEISAFLEAWKRGHGEHFNFNLIGLIKEAHSYSSGSPHAIRGERFGKEQTSSCSG